MTKLVIAALVLGAANTAAPALADTPINFEKDGYSVVATVAQEGDALIYQGRELNSGDAFTLRVRNGYVRGTVGGRSVAYPVPKPRRAASNEH